MKILITVLAITFLSSIVHGQKPRARDLGIPFVGTTGQFNAITDVKGVEVGHSRKFRAFRTPIPDTNFGLIRTVIPV